MIFSRRRQAFLLWNLGLSYPRDGVYRLFGVYLLIWLWGTKVGEQIGFLWGKTKAN